MVASFAQPMPKIQSVSREWIQRGTTAEVTVSGDNLGSATRFIVSGDPGVKADITAPANPIVKIESNDGGISAIAAKEDKKISAKIFVAPDAPLGDRELRLVSATGVSNPIPLHIGQLPEVARNGAVSSLEKAQLVELPAAISGTISSGAESDHYRFTGKKGDLIIVDVFGSRLGSPIDPSLAVLDKSGKELARSEDVNGLDPLLAFKVPNDGEYILQLRDFQYRGGGDYRYRILAGVMPYVFSVFPLGARREQDVEVEVRGYNFANPKLTLHVDAHAPVGRQDIRASTPMGISNPFSFDVTDLPEFTEKEPNNQTNQANQVTIPVVINGRIQTEKDKDFFKFKVQKNQQIIFEVLATRLGSSLDALLTLTDANGKVIERNDDAVGADARIERTFSEAGEYMLAVEDLLGRSGDNFSYRLSVRIPLPSFEVRFFPDNPRVSRGGHVPVRCEINRLNGFNGTVRVAMSGLPGGVFCEPVLLMPSAAASAWLMLSASEDCPLGTFPLKMTASSTLNGKTISQAAEPLSNDKPVKEAFLTVLDHPSFALELATLTAELEQGNSAGIDVVAERRDGFNGDIKLSADGYSSDRQPITRSLEISSPPLKGNEAHGALKLKANLNSEIGTRPIFVKGEANVNGQVFTEYSALLPATIKEIPFVLTTTLKRLSVSALPSSSNSAAREAVFSVKAGRRMGFTNEIDLKLEGLPEGVTASINKIPANANETTVKLVASEKAPVGKDYSLRILGVGQFGDRTYRNQPGEIKLAITAPSEPAEVAHAETK